MGARASSRSLTEHRSVRRRGGRLSRRALVAVLGICLAGSSTAVAGAARTTSSATSAKKAKAPLCHGNKIQIGLDSSLSGIYSFFGQPGLWGTEAYVDYINSIGGVYGCKFKIDVNNDQSTPSLAAANTRKEVVQNHDMFLFGPADSADGAAAIPVADSMHVVDLVWGSGWYWTGTTRKEDLAWAFPGHFDVYDAENIAMNNEVIVPHHYKRVAVIMDQGASTNVVGKDEKRLAKLSHGKFKVVAEQFLTPGQVNDTPAVLNLLGAHPDFIIDGVAPGQDTVVFLKALRAQNPTIPFGDCAGCDNPSFVKAVGGPAIMKNVYLGGTDAQLANTLPHTKANIPIIKDIDKYYTWMKKSGHGAIDEVNTADWSWQTMEMLVNAIRKTHSLNENRIRHALAHEKDSTMYVHWHRTPKNYESYTINFLPTDTVSSTGRFVPLKPPSGS